MSSVTSSEGQENQQQEERSAPPASLVCGGTAAGGELRFVAAELTATLEEARLRADLGPLATLALAQTALSACLLLRLPSKPPRRLEIDVQGDGLLGKVSSEATIEGGVRGVVQNPHVCGPLGKDDLDLAAGYGSGLLKVRRIDARGGAYESNVGLVKGDLALDLAHYLEQSEQRQAAVLFGVRLDARGLRRAGGVILEALPGASSATVQELEQRLAGLGSVNEAVSAPGSEGVESLLDQALGGGWTIHSRWPTSFRCRCSREALAERLGELSRADLQEVFGDLDEIVADCAYCGTGYRFTREELLAPN